MRLLPEGYGRAAVVAPILFLVPGSVTLGAVWDVRRRPQGATFVCFAALLGVIWSVFASLALYVFGVLISANNTYWCLLVVSAALAVVAEARILFGRLGAGNRAIHRAETLDPDLHDSEIGTAEMPATKGAGYYALLAIIGGLGLLFGGAYVIDHIPHPAPTGYTWIAWTGPTVEGVISIGPAGTELPFQIVHQQSDTVVFHLKAEWLGAPSRPLAGPLALTIGPNRTLHGHLFIPPLHNGCTYRIVVTLSSNQQIGQLTKTPQTWSINADVHDPSKSSKICGS